MYLNSLEALSLEQVAHRKGEDRLDMYVALLAIISLIASSTSMNASDYGGFDVSRRPSLVASGRQCTT